jgi:chromosome segregation ATPase
MDREKFQTELESAKTRLVRLEKRRGELDVEREKLDGQIDDLKRDIRALAQLAGESEDIALGLTAACKEIFANTTAITLSQTDVKERLEAMGFPIDEQKHPLASIGKTLRRLATAGILNQVSLADGRTGFRAKPKVQPIPRKA